ncbi:MAG: hypothetical protein BAA01_04105 [Bacillus thermozeamaize]|uniref:Uncharacterized protein n=1 Tax=Bacillus thermozeamaize TaxID=230954 RepID=A0A1Y3PHG3_9BACI|nr:MAG: hypothetical protein BAA01_04105 [Bacillus thermozeamaize]
MQRHVGQMHRFSGSSQVPNLGLRLLPGWLAAWFSAAYKPDCLLRQLRQAHLPIAAWFAIIDVVHGILDDHDHGKIGAVSTHIKILPKTE